MKNKPLVSIITPSYNSSDFIIDTIESVINQSYQNWEMLITDDCSKDNTIEVIKKYQLKDKRIKLYQLENNSGPAIARNNSIANSTGKFISFLDSDDLWESDKLEEQISFMLSNNYPFTYSYYTQINEENEFIKKVDYLPKKVNYVSMMKFNTVGCLTAIYDADFFGKIYMDNLFNRQDYSLWLKLIKKAKFAYCFPKILARYRIRNNSISSNKFKLIKFHWIIYRRIEKQNFFMASYYLGNYLINKIVLKK